MEAIATKVFQVDSPQAQTAYKARANYRIETFPDRDSDLCALYFSSNEIYYPNTAAVFEREILGKDKFEWWGVRIKKSAKDILIRDIRKQWYLTGINAELSTIEKLAERLKAETKGMRVITLGSSSGGFAAILFGHLLGAERVLAFNPQFNIEDLLERSSEEKDPIVFRYAEDPSYRQYFDITDRISPKVFYFCSTLSKWDSEQIEFVRERDINIFRFRCRNHGIPFPRTLLPIVLNLSPDELKKWTGKPHHPFLFSVHYRGWWQSAFDIAQLLLKRFRKKRQERLIAKTNGR